MERRAKRPAAKGRGSPENPAGRFERIEFVAADDCPDEPPRSPATVYYRDDAKRIISRNDSPDVPFGASMNPYRGCEHGCVYCYARPTHEYLGLSAGLDFETKIFVKENAAELLRAELASPGWTPEPVAVSGVTDCYQPAERRFGITRKCLEVFLEFRNPVGVVTKSGLVARDADVLSELAKVGCASVIVSITTLDGELARRMEPRASQPRRRLEAVEALASAGIAVTVLVAPVIPGLTDHEIPAILKEARRRGAADAGYVMLRLPHGVGDLFFDWLGRNYPRGKKKVLGRIQSVRGGKTSSARYGERMRGSGVFAEQIERMFRVSYGRLGFEGKKPLDVSRFRSSRPAQLPLL